MNMQKCPFDAIMIINLPKNLEKECTHRYGSNTFKLHRWGHSFWTRSFRCMLHREFSHHVPFCTCTAVVHVCSGVRGWVLGSP